jgi:hypothetical protein
MVDKGSTEKRVRDGIYDPHFCCAKSPAPQVFNFLRINRTAGVARRTPASISFCFYAAEKRPPDDADPAEAVGPKKIKSPEMRQKMRS